MHDVNVMSSQPLVSSIAAMLTRERLVTFAYWPADEGWAIPEWERIISTLRLAGQSPDLVPDSSAGAPTPR
jgi:hypothetical protein